MSDEDHSGDNKSFLARWSQRKHEAKQSGRDVQTAGPETPSGPVPRGDAAQEFDLSSLPKLEDMSATTDITAFLRKGVPEHLRNAALRQSWALDPAIRNYVNPALDYAYDWNTPGGVPGSSEIGAGMDVARLVSQIMGSGRSAVEPPERAVATENEAAIDPATSSEPGATQESEPGLPTESLRSGNKTISTVQESLNTGDAPAAAEDSEECKSVAPQQVRRHGSAKPQV